MKVTVGCMVGVGEQIQCELEIPEIALKQAEKKDYQYLDSLLKPAFRVLDNRRYELNKRLMEGYQAASKLPAEVKFALQQALDVLHGRATEPQASQPSAEAIQADKDNILKELEKLDPEDKAMMGKVISIDKHPTSGTVA